MLFVCVQKCFVLSNHFPFINTLKEKIMSSHQTYFVRLTWKLGCPALGNWENARKTWFFHSEWTIPSIWINNASERKYIRGKYVGRKLDWVVVTEIFPLFLPFFIKRLNQVIVRVETVFPNVWLVCILLNLCPLFQTVSCCFQGAYRSWWMSQVVAAAIGQMLVAVCGK